MLNRRDYGVRELSVSLVARGFGQATADTVIGQLAAEKLVDDSRFAEHFVAYHANRGQGPVRIAHRLREAGVAGEQVAAAVDANAAEWRQRCVDVRRRRFGAKPPATWAERGRQGRFLSQRGFSADQIRAAIGKDFDEE
jgi:regulatory protein